jgi:hypothetical protein
MDMEMEVANALEANLGLALDRLSAAAGLLEQAAERFSGLELGLELNATQATAREQQLEERLAQAEATIASLRAEATRIAPMQAETVRASGRKTAPAAAPALASREGVSVEASALDASLRSLSIEQRIAVKAEMLRTGLLS